MLETKKLSTPQEGFIPITRDVQSCITREGIQEGYCIVFCPHTTAGLTINENSDPDVVHDLLLGLQTAFGEDRRFRHAEGNSTAHLKASAMGSSVMVPIQGGKLVLGIWQDIYFCEFDGPRLRTYHIQVIAT
jgi:secondary thiamine-phosphate synthase enzyme